MVFIVQDGAIKVTIEGTEPFTATKGFMVNIACRHVYTRTSDSRRALARREHRSVTDARSIPPHPKATGTPGPSKDRDSNLVYLDFWKQAGSGKLPTIFARDDHITVNVIRAKGQPVPPDSNKGHFHIDNGVLVHHGRKARLQD